MTNPEIIVYCATALLLAFAAGWMLGAISGARSRAPDFPISRRSAEIVRLRTAEERKAAFAPYPYQPAPISEFGEDVYLPPELRTPPFREYGERGMPTSPGAGPMHGDRPRV